MPSRSLSCPPVWNSFWLLRQGGYITKDSQIFKQQQVCTAASYIGSIKDCVGIKSEKTDLQQHESQSPTLNYRKQKWHDTRRQNPVESIQ
jgi:hypothetical protein